MEEKVVNISHKLILDNRKEASVTGVKDVISFDEKEILLQTADGTGSCRFAAAGFM
ncbi:MAG: YabP/YqfC family sporulation protein [Blautia faecis]